MIGYLKSLCGDSKGKKRVTFMYIKLTKDIYDKVVTRKRTKKDITSKFPILVGSHQG